MVGSQTDILLFGGRTDPRTIGIILFHFGVLSWGWGYGYLGHARQGIAVMPGVLVTLLVAGTSWVMACVELGRGFSGQPQLLSQGWYEVLVAGVIAGAHGKSCGNCLPA